MKNLILLFLFSFVSHASFAQIERFPANMYLDTLYTPFLHGVASGDPLSNQVIIWTRITPNNSVDELAVEWEMALDTAFDSIVNSGSVIASSETDWTIKVDVDQLMPNQTYYYRFKNEQGRLSAIGSTKTAPLEAVEQLKFAVASCSSIYSGFFTAYRHIAERDDLDLFIHLGDYVYDFVDRDEQVRVPVPFPTTPQTLEEWQNLHEYYLADPDLRLVRQKHPMALLWDNHDVDRLNPEASTKAFLEWNPIRLPNPLDSSRIYRTLHYGALVDLFLVDIWRYRNQDTLESGAASTLSTVQFDWLENELSQSTAQWKLIGNQKLFTNWSTENVPPGFPVDGDVFDADSWDGFPDERLKVMDILEEQALQNVIFISGHLHVSVAADVPRIPKDANNYDPATGAGSLAVEFLPPSISRGNLDEAGFSLFTDLATQISLSQNPHHKYLDLTEHGYGLLTIEPKQSTAQYWYTDILNVDAEEQLAKELFVLEGESHWRTTAVGTQNTLPTGYQISEIYPNPTNESTFYINLTLPKTEPLQFTIVDNSGKVIQTFQKVLSVGEQIEQFNLPTSSEIYWLVIRGAQFTQVKEIVNIR